MRTFVAIALEPKIKHTLSQFIQNLDDHDPNVRWVREQGMHLTLKFIGEITENQVEEIRTVLMDLSANHERFFLKLKGTGTFPPRSKYPRIVWVGIEESQELVSVQHDVESLLEKVSISRENRRFFPHLTLGRVKSNRNIEPVLGMLSENKDTEFGSMEVQKITFFKSTLKPTGAEYSALERIRLK
ncbi:MAG: RNA 2',3'-cyclic phosphodiesterase [Candidatus Aminicenantes bacterium]|jgi:2'-5' RNA ligase